MKMKSVALLVGACLSGHAMASSLSGNSQAKTLAMGGAGVAVLNYSTAGTVNPAVLSMGKEDSGFEFVLPSIKLGAGDKDQFIERLDDFQDSGVIDSLKFAIDQAGPVGSYVNVADAADQLSSSLSELSDRGLSGNGSVLMALSLPTNSGYGFAVSLSSKGKLAGVIRYRDGALLKEFTDELRGFDACAQDVLSCDADLLNAKFIDVNSGAVNFDPDSDLLSYVQIKGVSFAELGLSVSKDFQYKDVKYSVGITPKVVKASIVNYIANVNSAELEDYNELVDSEVNFNADLGVLVAVNESLNLGFVVNDVLSTKYTSRENQLGETHSLEVEPKYKVGASYQAGFFTLAGDLDLNSTIDELGREEQRLSVGAEVNAFDLAQVRVGYQHDLVDADGSMATLGLGLSPFGVYLDIGAAFNEREVVAGVQAGFKW